MRRRSKNAKRITSEPFAGCYDRSYYDQKGVYHPCYTNDLSVGMLGALNPSTIVGLAAAFFAMKYFIGTAIKYTGSFMRRPFYVLVIIFLAVMIVSLVKDAMLRQDICNYYKDKQELLTKEQIISISKCPHCGKANPAYLQACRYCNNQLTVNNNQQAIPEYEIR